MGVGVMTGRWSALPARHRNTTSPLVRTRQPWGIAQPRLLRPAVTQHTRPKKLRLISGKWLWRRANRGTRAVPPWM